MENNDKYIGTLLDDRYEILQVIGEGGMAIVYKALDHRLNRNVAVKIMREDMLADEEFRSRFCAEAHAVAMLSHPNIVAVYDVSHSDAMEYIVMELVEGITLRQYMDRRGALAWREVLHFTKQIAKAIAHAHERGIIHRDIKPSNIIITSYNYAMLLDFNAAKQFSGQNESDTVLIGTPGYAAPEQYGFGSSSPKTDIYSLGIVLREMLGSITPVPDIAPILHRLNLISDRCTQMTPAARYQSVAELKNAVSQSYYPAQHSTSAAGNSSQYAHQNHDNAANADTAKRAIHDSASRFLPPGFRTRTPWKMLLSSVAYLFIIWLCLSLELENTYGAKLWLERIFCLGMFIFAIFCGFNYLNVQNILPLCKSKNRFLHYVGIILLDVAVIFALFVIMFIIESVAFPIK